MYPRSSSGMSIGSSRQGFTLIELLVVIAIISLLVSMLLPSLKKAKELARSAVCMSNERSVGSGLAMYLSNNESMYPIQTNVIWNGSLSVDSGFSARAISHELTGEWPSGNDESTWADAMLCPDGPRDGSEASQMHNYGMNYRDCGGWSRKRSENGSTVGDALGVTAEDVPWPSEKAASLDMPGQVGIYGFNQAYVWHLFGCIPGCGTYGMPVDTPYSFTPDYYRDQQNGRHGLTISTLFLDGHVEKMSAEEVTDEYHFAGALQWLVKDNIFNMWIR